MYNVVEKLRSGEALTPKERTIHELAACGVLRDLHDELDALVAEAYGWPMEREEILERLVALHSAITTLVAQRAVTVDDVVASFSGARRDLIARHLDTLALMGEVTRDGGGRYAAARKVA